METIYKNQIVTKETIIERLVQLGVKKGMIIEVHASLSSFGYVIGGAQTVVDALMEVVTSAGTILMPYQTRNNTEPSRWRDPAIEPLMVPYVRDNMPPYDALSSDARNMGDISENFKRRKDVVVSTHPQYGFSAWGHYAKALCNGQSLHFGLAQESPIERLYELKGCVLLLGVDYDRATCMHLAEYKSDVRPIVIEGAKVNVNEKPVWKKFLDLDCDSRIFNKIGKSLEDKNKVGITTIGNAKVKLFRSDVAIDEATTYFEKYMPYDMYR